MSAVRLEVGTEGQLTATESVLEMSIEEDEFIGYNTDEGNSHETTVYIERDLYNELGRPIVITVRIVPGDTLNG